MSATRPATIRDVSRLARVSRVTVTRTLSEPALVRPETRERVQSAIESLGYVPDRAAGSLASRRTGFVGLVVPTLTNVNFATVAHALTGVLRREGYQLLVAYDDYSLAEQERQLRSLIARRPEAIVVTGAVHTPAAAGLLARADVPVIEIAQETTHPVRHAVGFSNEAVGRMAARHLIDRGHRRIGAIGSLPGDDVADFRGEARLRGFEEELRVSGHATDLVLRLGAAPVDFDHGVAAVAALLGRAPDIDAVFCVSDLSAVGAIMECGRRGIDVPGRLAVIGFGDFDIGRVINPPLSTIRVDFNAIGRAAGELVLDLTNRHGGGDPRSIGIEPELIERGSVGAGPWVRQLGAID